MQPNPFAVAATGAVNRATGEVYEETAEVTLAAWQALNADLQKMKAAESTLREKVIGIYGDPERVKGTENTELGNGWKLQIKKNLRYTLKSGDESVTTAEAVAAVMTLMCKYSSKTIKAGAAEVYAEGLVRWTPEISATAYEKLPDELKALLEPVLEIKTASPTVAVIEPKEKK